jgi:ABC-2 type transport system permease protein
LRASPVHVKTVRHAKLAAAILPVCILILPALGYLLLRDPALALFMLVVVIAAMGSASLIQLWHIKPGTRDKFNKRGQAQFTAGLLEAVSSFSWSGTIFVSLKFGAWGLLPFGVALFILGLAWLLRIERKDGY